MTGFDPPKSKFSGSASCRPARPAIVSVAAPRSGPRARPAPRRFAPALGRLASPAGLFARPLVPDTPVLNCQLSNKPALGVNGITVAVPQWEISVAQLRGQ